MLLKPRRLEWGDTIGIVAPASAPADPSSIDRSVAFVSQLGFKPKLGARTRRREGFLAGSDADRSRDLMDMFLDAKVKAILCVRGGYGTARLLSRLDYTQIRAHPKIFVGYSDITSLHCAFLKKANLITFHGPMSSSDLIKKDLPDFTRQSFLRTLTEPSPPGNLCQGYTGKSISVLRPGIATGQLIGGNISILCATLGTPYQVSFRNKILFFEDLDEVPYRFDRMLTHLLNAGLLQQVAGVAIGINKNCGDPKSKRTKEYRQTLLEVFAERLLPLKVPVVCGLPFGHIPHNATLPVGARATLDANAGELSIIEAVVS